MEDLRAKSEQELRVMWRALDAETDRLAPKAHEKEPGNPIESDRSREERIGRLLEVRREIGLVEKEINARVKRK